MEPHVLKAIYNGWNSYRQFKAAIVWSDNPQKEVSLPTARGDLVVPSF